MKPKPKTCRRCGRPARIELRRPALVLDFCTADCRARVIDADAKCDPADQVLR